MATIKKALVINDNPEIGAILSEALAKVGYSQISAGSEAGLRNILEKEVPDAIIFGLMSSDVCKEVTALVENGTLTLKIVGYSESQDTVRLLIRDEGEYLTHPISVSLLGKQICILLKELEGRRRSYKFACGPLLFNARERIAEYDDKTVKFTRCESELLHALVENKGLLVPYDKLSPQYDDPLSKKAIHRVNVHIAAVRKKLKTLTGNGYIKSMYDLGYVFHEGENA